MIDLAKKNPGTLNFASPGLGSGGFIAGALFKKLAGVDIVHVPYKSHPEAMTAMVRGDAQIYFTPLNATDELVGKLRALAVTTAARRTCGDVRKVPEAEVRIHTTSAVCSYHSLSLRASMPRLLQCLRDPPYGFELLVA